MPRLTILFVCVFLAILLLSNCIFAQNEACQLPDGSCLTVDPQFCISPLNGTPQGPGTSCTPDGVCCIEEGFCAEIDSLACADSGGVFHSGVSCVNVTCSPECEYAITDEGLNPLLCIAYNIKPDYNYPSYDHNGDCFIDFDDLYNWYNWLNEGTPGLEPAECTCIDPVWYADSCEHQFPGDANNNSNIDIQDAVFLTSWLFRDGAAPENMSNADPNGNCCVDTNDIIYIFEYVFADGPPPVECTCIDIDVCPDTCEGQTPGDVNGLAGIDIGDLMFLFNWIYNGGPEPAVKSNADVDGNCCIDTFDIAYLRDYILDHGPPPVDCTCLDVDLCPEICDSQYPGDVNKDGSINIGDEILLLQFLTQGGENPGPNADVNGDCSIEFCDAYYLHAYLLQGGPAPVDCTCLGPDVCDCNVADANYDGQINIGDAITLVNYIFMSGDAPTPYALCSGDLNADCTVNIGDVVGVVNYVFNSGPAPPCCHDWIDDATGCGLPLR